MKDVYDDKHALELQLADEREINFKLQEQGALLEAENWQLRTSVVRFAETYGVPTDDWQAEAVKVAVGGRLDPLLVLSGWCACRRHAAIGVLVDHIRFSVMDDHLDARQKVAELCDGFDAIVVLLRGGRP